MPAERKVALVTGASSAVGRAIARRLASPGWSVGLLARRRDRLEEVAGEIGDAGGDAHVLAGDLRHGAFAKRAVADLVSRAGRLDLVVNHAAALARAAEQEISDAELDDLLAVNVRSVYRLSHAALPHLQATRGCIVNVGWAGVPRNLASDLAYLASKGAVETISRGMARNWACSLCRAAACRRTSRTRSLFWLPMRRPSSRAPRSTSMAGWRWPGSPPMPPWS